METPAREDVDLCDITHVQRAKYWPIMEGNHSGVLVHDLYAKGKSITSDSDGRIKAEVATQLALALRVSPRNALGVIEGMCERYATALKAHRACTPMEIGNNKRVVYDAASRARVEAERTDPVWRATDAKIAKRMRCVQNLEAEEQETYKAYGCARNAAYEAQDKLSESIAAAHTFVPVTISEPVVSENV